MLQNYNFDLEYTHIQGELIMARKKIKIDPSACMGCGACAGSYPDDVVINDDGIAEAVSGEADEEIVSICPFGAISEDE